MATANPIDLGGAVAINVGHDQHIGIDVADIDKAAVCVDSALTTPSSAHRRVESKDIASKEDREGQDSTERTPVTRKDVVKVFKESTGTCFVTREEVARIKQMHNKISEGVEFNFNYYSLLMISSIVAGLGLASDSTTTVISSMLLSPIMGPVIGMAYGLVIWDLELIKRSARNECASVVVCIFFGVVIALTTGWTTMASETWPTDEMLSRGERQTILIGIPIAFFSGLGVALSVLDDSMSSLVGVAISASLLPPAVNAGLLWMYAGMVKVGNTKHEETASQDLVRMGLVSLGLTVANVLAVGIGAAFMFRMKEVLPIKKKVFWDDLKIARRIYQNRAYAEDYNDEVAVANTFGESTDDHPLMNPDNDDTGEDIEQGV